MKKEKEKETNLRTKNGFFFWGSKKDQKKKRDRIQASASDHEKGVGA